MNATREPQKNIRLHLHSRAFHHANSNKPGMTVRCEGGLVWLTNSNDLQDYMLRPGHSMVVAKRSDVLIEALSEADITIIYPN